MQQFAQVEESDPPVIAQNMEIWQWMHYMDANKTAGEEARRQLHKNAGTNIEQVLAETPHKTPTIRPPASHHEKLYKLDEPGMQDTAGEAGTSS